MNVKFSINKFLDPRKQGSELVLNQPFIGQLSDDGLKVYYTDKALCDWVFFIGDTCTLVDEIDAAIATLHQFKDDVPADKNEILRRYRKIKKIMKALDDPSIDDSCKGITDPKTNEFIKIAPKDLNEAISESSYYSSFDNSATSDYWKEYTNRLIQLRINILNSVKS